MDPIHDYSSGNDRQLYGAVTSTATSGPLGIKGPEGIIEGPDTGIEGQRLEIKGPETEIKGPKIDIILFACRALSIFGVTTSTATSDPPEIERPPKDRSYMSNLEAAHRVPMDAAYQPPRDKEIRPFTGGAKKPHRKEAGKPSQKYELKIGNMEIRNGTQRGVEGDLRNTVKSYLEFN